jgi:hypothetical protein
MLMRAISSSVLALQLSSGAVVTALLEKGLSQSEMTCLGRASALKPARVCVELGPYSVQKRGFTQCKLAGSSAPETVVPVAAATTKYRRVK